MDAQYEQFCTADPLFYDSPTRAGAQPAGETYRAGRGEPEGWSLLVLDGWTYLSPDDAQRPAQGWKVHVSATLDNAAELLDAVWSYCVPRRIPFKFLTDRTTLLLRNGKYADRGGSGKFVTVYPAGAAELESLVRGLDAEIGGRPGPYILNDLRWGAGPVHLRYGGFARRWCRAPGGELVPAVAEPDGRLVPDYRVPYFEVPPWAEVPDFLAPHIASRQSEEAPADFPYRIERPLHFSNGGGIYLATDTRTDRQVVLREARPYAGLDGAGRDAVQRLRREREFLEKLAGTGVVPELYDHVTCWEHHFLVEEYIEGQTLGSAFVHRYPLIHPDCTAADVAGYTGWALEVLERVRECLRVMHDHGIVFGDLHPYNIMVGTDGRVRFVDLEVASYVDEDQRLALGAAGYVPADGRRGVAADRYALACLSVSLFLPLTALLGLDAYRAEVLAPSVARLFPVPAGYAGQVAAELRPGSAADAPAVAVPDRGRVGALADALEAGEVDWPALRDSIAAAALASATPEREDRLFPGDIRQFRFNGLGFAYGAAGVLHGLAAAGAGRFPEHERWLLDAARQPREDVGSGFYDGLHGIAYTLEELGRRDDALSVLRQALDSSLDGVSAGLFDGLAGVGLSLLHFAARTGDRDLHARALDAADRLVDLTGRPAPQDDLTGRPRAGLMHGPSGHALFHLGLYRATGEEQFLDLAGSALRRDLANTVEVEDGTVQLDEGWRVMPYVATGSAGIGLVLDRYLAHRDDPELAAALVGIGRAAEPEFIINAGLFNGRAGLIALQARLRDAGRTAAGQPVIDRHLRRLAWHVMDYQGEVAFPGDKMRRLSMDLATGSVGVLLALATALGTDRPVLPFL